MEENTYKIKRLFFYNLFQKGYNFDYISREIGYEPDFLMNIIDGKIPVSKSEIINILDFIDLEEKDLIEDNNFKYDNETSLKKAFNMFMNEYDKDIK